MEIQIARAGEVIGTFTPEEIEQHIAQGSLNPDDQFWREGMVDWKPLEHLNFYLPKQPISQPPEIPIHTDAGHDAKGVAKTKMIAFWMIAVGVVLVGVAGSMNSEAGGGKPGGAEILWGMTGGALLLIGFIMFISARMKQ